MTVKQFFNKPFCRPIAEWCNLPRFVRSANVLNMRINEFAESMRLVELFLYRTVADMNWKRPGQGRKYVACKWIIEVPEVIDATFIKWQIIELIPKVLEVKFKKMDWAMGKV